MARRNREIDWLRAYAVCFVIIEHASLIMHGPWFWDGVRQWFWGTGGVDLFFVISGLVISQSFVDEFDIARGKPHGGKIATAQSVVRFYVRRFLRLYPAALAWALIVMAATIFLNQSHIWLDINATFKKLIAVAMYLYNFQEAQQQPTMLGYYWSLSLEMQFYLFFPLFLMLVKSPRRRIIILLVLLFARILYQPGEGERWLFRFDGILVGILLFYFGKTWIYRAMAPRFLESSSVKMAYSLVLLVLIATAPLPLLGYPNLANAAVWAFSGLLVWAAMYGEGYIFSFGVPRLLDWIGSRSYSIYLCQIPMMLINRAVLFLVLKSRGVELNNHDHWWMLLLGWVISMAAAAELTYRMIEVPSQRKGRDLARSIVFNTGKD